MQHIWSKTANPQSQFLGTPILNVWKWRLLALHASLHAAGMHGCKPNCSHACTFWKEVPARLEGVILAKKLTKNRQFLVKFRQNLEKIRQNLRGKICRKLRDGNYKIVCFSQLVFLDIYLAISCFFAENDVKGT